MVLSARVGQSTNNKEQLNTTIEKERSVAALLEHSEKFRLCFKLIAVFRTTTTTNQPTNQPANQPTSQPANQPTSQPATHPPTQPTNQPNNNNKRRLIFTNGCEMLENPTLSPPYPPSLCGCSLDWFKGKSTGNNGFYHYKQWFFPLNVPSKHSEIFTDVARSPGHRALPGSWPKQRSFVSWPRCSGQRCEAIKQWMSDRHP